MISIIANIYRQMLEIDRMMPESHLATKPKRHRKFNHTNISRNKPPKKQCIKTNTSVMTKITYNTQSNKQRKGQ